MADRQLKVTLVGDTKNLDRALGRAETRLQKFGRNTSSLSAGTSLSGKGGLAGLSAFGKAGAAGGVALGLGLAGQKVIELTNAASDLNEQLSASNVVFGSSGKEIESWSKTLATSFGIAQTEGVAAAATFGSLFSAAGSTKARAAELAKSVVELAGDLASFKNTTVDEAVQSLRSGLSGEIEPLRKYQVFLTEAAVAQEALAETGKRSTKQLTQGEKILARYTLILRQTKDAQGDAARTSDSYANQQRQLNAELKNFEVTVGKILLPSMTKLLTKTNEGIGVVGNIANAFQAAGEETKGWADKLLDLRDALRLPGFNGGIRLTAKAQAAAEAIVAPGEGNLGGSRAGGPGKPGTVTGPSGPPVALRNRFFDNKIGRELDRVQDLVPAAQIKALQGIRSEIEAKIRATKDPTRKLTLGDEIAQINRDIKSLDEQIIQDAKDKSDAAKAAKKKLQAANKKALQALKQLGDDIKSAVLDAFDSKTNKVDLAADVAKAKQALRNARQIGGPQGIIDAKLGLFDANRAFQRQQIVDQPFRVTGGPKGPIDTLRVGNIVININGAQDPDKIATQVIAAIRKRSKTNAGQSRGRTSGNPMHR